MLALALPLLVREVDADLATRATDIDTTVVLGDAQHTLENVDPFNRAFNPTLVNDQIGVLLAELVATAVAVAKLVLVHLATEAIDHPRQCSEEPLLVGWTTWRFSLVLLCGVLARGATHLVRFEPS